MAIQNGIKEFSHDRSALIIQIYKLLPGFYLL